jgi:hypothetical protein
VVDVLEGVVLLVASAGGAGWFEPIMAQAIRAIMTMTAAMTPIRFRWMSRSASWPVTGSRDSGDESGDVSGIAISCFL